MLTFQEIDATIPNLRLSKKDYPGKDKVWEYLEKRGINRDLAEICGLDIISETDLNAALYRDKEPKISNRICVVFPHHDQSGELISWWSARLIDVIPELKVVRATFADLVDKTKIKKKKMTCPSGEPPHAYLAPGMDWSTIPRGEKIYIHESCIKAINGSDLGKYSVGLNGVWGWKAEKKYGMNLVEEIIELPWKYKDLKPVIVFDSGIRRNDNVAWAATQLAATLKDITGQDATLLKVPDAPGGEEWGFDDFRMGVGDGAALEFLESAGEGIDFSESELMFQKLNQEVCVIRDLGVIVEQETGVIMSKAKFTEVNYAAHGVWDRSGPNSKWISGSKSWLTNPRRTTAVTMDYLPGEERLVKNDGLSVFNLWKQSGCEPLAGNVDWWMELLANNVEDEYLRDWIVSWFAFLVQNPGVKMNTSPLIFGPSGTGKGLFIKPFRIIFGDNAVTVSNDQLRSSFNSIYANRQLIHADELRRVRDEGDLANQRIKLLVTDDKMIVNGKGTPEYGVRNCANLVLTSNYYDCVKLDQDDRRMCVVHWIPTSSHVDHRGDQPYWIKVVAEIEGEGPGVLYQFLLEWDWRGHGFDPYAWAPGTKSKEDVTEASMAPMEVWVKDLWREPDSILTLGEIGKCLFTAKELARLYYGIGENDLTQGQIKAITNALRNQGFVQANGGNPLRPEGKEGMQNRFWVIKNREDKGWDTSKKCLAHLKAVL